MTTAKRGAMQCEATFIYFIISTSNLALSLYINQPNSGSQTVVTIKMIMSSLDARQYLIFICHLFQYKRTKKTLTCVFDKMLSCVLVFKLFLNKVCFVYIKGQRIKREASCEAGQLLLGDRNRRDGRMKSFFPVCLNQQRR